MKDLSSKIIANLHYIILLYGLYALWGHYDEHDRQMNEINAQKTTLEQEQTQTKQKLGEIQEFVKKADEYKVRVEEVAKNIETVQKQLPAETNDSHIVTYFSQEMNTLNMKDPGITPGKEESTTYFISKDYALKAKGTYLQFLIFFERLGTAARIYNVKSLKLTVLNESKKGRFQMVSGEGIIQAFRYNPEFKVDRGFDNKGVK